jgi:hypothetical protein
LSYRDDVSTSNILGKDLQAKLAECHAASFHFTDYECNFLDAMSRLPVRLYSPKQIALLNRLYVLACQKLGGFTR